MEKEGRTIGDTREDMKLQKGSRHCFFTIIALKKLTVYSYKNSWIVYYIMLS